MPLSRPRPKQNYTLHQVFFLRSGLHVLLLARRSPPKSSPAHGLPFPGLLLDLQCIRTKHGSFAGRLNQVRDKTWSRGRRRTGPSTEHVHQSLSGFSAQFLVTIFCSFTTVKEGIGQSAASCLLIKVPKKLSQPWLHWRCLLPNSAAGTHFCMEQRCCITLHRQYPLVLPV